MHLFWRGSFHLNHAISYINYFVFSELDLVCLTTTDEWKETKHKFFGLDQIMWKETNRVEKHSIITICKYLVDNSYPYDLLHFEHMKRQQND